MIIVNFRDKNGFYDSYKLFYNSITRFNPSRKELAITPEMSSALIKDNR